jgi:hypothetical protein
MPGNENETRYARQWVRYLDKSMDRSALALAKKAGNVTFVVEGGCEHFNAAVGVQINPDAKNFGHRLGTLSIKPQPPPGEFHPATLTEKVVFSPHATSSLDRPMDPLWQGRHQLIHEPSKGEPPCQERAR